MRIIKSILAVFSIHLGLLFPLLSHAQSPTRISYDDARYQTSHLLEHQVEPHLAASPEDPNLMITCYQNARLQDGGAKAIRCARSSDGGTTWSEQELPGTSKVNHGKYARVTDPWLGFGRNGKVYVSTLNFASPSLDKGCVNVSISDDGGVSYRDPVAVFCSSKIGPDKNALVVDNNLESPNYGNIYVAWTNNYVNSQGVLIQSMVVSTSRDNGESWSRPHTLRLTGANVGAVPVVTRDGKVIIIWAGDDNVLTTNLPYLNIATSLDGGKRWTKVRQFISRNCGDSVAGIRTGVCLPSVSYDSASGNLYVASHDVRNFKTGIQLLVSSNDGKRWTKGARVGPPAGSQDCFNPVIHPNVNGDLGLAFYCSAESRIKTTARYAVSTDMGKTFSRSGLIFSKPFNLQQAISTGLGKFLGDYFGLVSVTDKFVFVGAATYFTSLEDPSLKQSDIVAGTF